MLRCMYSGISGMKVNQTKLDVIGNNIANVGTTAFKSSSARFKDMLYQNSSEATAPTSVLGGTNAKQIGLGAQLSSINKVMGQGNALSTGRSLDVCIDGDGYLVVSKGDLNSGIGADQATGEPDTAASDAAGQISETLFTRDGNLTLDYQGNLLTSDGHRVMGYYLTSASNNGVKSLAYDQNNNVINANYVSADSKDLAVSDNTMRPLVIPDSVTISGTPGAADAVTQPVKKFEIGKDGVITAVLGDGKRAAIGQIAMASFKNPEGLTDLGGNMCINSSNSGPIVYKTGKVDTSKSSSTTTATGNQGGFGSLIQGALEGSNVDLTEQFTDMITATRSFQAASKMVTTGDEILQTITGLMR
ncbi:flagellar biosynthesis protein FlgE [Clostridium sp. 2-1]|uniref:flagellar hook-basal body complex protein n=1 Tax=Clostridium TaxID=1485 RepID=UPI000CDAC0B4|nr:MULTISPECIES: flagellar hook-basal body complex protein [Clostridium]MBN7573039.1 flagellar hook-basal body complex protein [Clostridium beijerinckii]MBN7578378.1 flagellar hook-basal body complex protein [Clostridium beijerinckii]MBN7582813.1 flagellar hook-basal body complex protein [Clostridium beijerinckii]MBO0518978.1 flagellar hook-basal body complex protein [Clostridium beijerinckii]POO93242.1 flagellar biosynthesis protein FlgE [Clostridium sp. 2-1]